jgi:hypothetical protein
MRTISVLTLFAVTIVGAALPAAAGPTPAGTAAQCGNGLLEAGESCASCAADCAVAKCQPGKTRVQFAVAFNAPEQAAVGTAVLRIAYRSDRLSLPGTGTAKTVQQRIASPQHAVMAFNDLDYALRVVAGRSGALPMGQVFTVEFDRCDGAPTPSPADLSCAVEACAGSTGPVDGCTCSITAAHS